MTRRPTQGSTTTKPAIRCAIYTRKSTEEGLDQAFNSLDAQRESAEAFIKSQAHEGWECLPEHYDDGGFTGANLERPAVRRLLADIQAGKIDCVVVYKVDRLSRSLLDFAKTMEIFDRHKVAFVSVTQQFNTAHSMGRLTLHILFSFAEFERQTISERTRDKVAATRRKGKWCGGHSILGYEVDPLLFRLVVNEEEAMQVRAIFALYVEHEGLVAVCQELEARGWTTKRWTTRKGLERGGKPFTKTSLHKLLTNIVYVGKVGYKDEVHAGEQAAIVDPVLWQKAQALLQRNGRSGGAQVRNQFGALLKGLLRCAACNCAMTPAHTTRNKTKRYRYYTCTNAQKRGWNACPNQSIPAGAIEHFVVDQIRCIGKDPDLLAQTLASANTQSTAHLEELEADQRSVGRDLTRWHADVQKIVQQASTAEGRLATLPRLADLQERIQGAERRHAELTEQVDALERVQVDESEVRQALADFDPVWDCLAPREQARILQLLIERIDFDGTKEKVKIQFHPSSMQSLARELAGYRQEQSA